MSLAAVTVLPLWASIVLALASPAVAAIAVWVGRSTQDATLRQQREQLTRQLAQQREQFEQQLAQQRDQVELQRNMHADDLVDAQYQHEETLRHQRQRDDLSEVRSVLDEAARALNDADRIHRDIYDDLGNAEKTEQLKQAGRKLDELKQRLAIRFGSNHRVTTAMSSCVDLSLQVFGATTHWRLEDHEYATDTAKRAMSDFEPAVKTFISVATRYAGVDLPKAPAG